MHPLLLPDCIPAEIWAFELLLKLLDVRDLMALENARMDLVVIPPGGTFVAARVLNAPELAWFTRRGIPVTLVERTELATDGGDAFAVYLNGELHRENDLPAVKLANGCQQWHFRGKLHRENGLPAIEYANGGREWWVDGKRHRENGLPAIEYANGGREWWVDGKRHRDNGQPAVDYGNGGREWWVDGKRHRDNDLPACVCSDGTTREWWVHGVRHRDGGMPAVITSVNAEWWEFDRRVW